MFRRQEGTLEPDPCFSSDLKTLGFFINNVGQIRMIEAPEKPYLFHATNNERVNEVLREAVQVCEREETEKRLAALGIARLFLPEFSTLKPTGPHVPILASPPEILKARKRIIVLVNDSVQDLGILSYRQLQQELGINGGSVINFVKQIILRSTTNDNTEKYSKLFDDGYKVDSDDDVPAVVIMNTGQLLYSHKHNQAMTMRSWSAMPRKSVVHDMIRIHDENRVQGHENPTDHVKSVFRNILCNPGRVAPNAEIYVVAIENGTETLLNLLNEDFEKYGSRITAMALVHSLVDDSQVTNTSLKEFLRERARQWRFCDLVVDPNHCLDLPENYNECLEGQCPKSTAKQVKDVRWNENAAVAGALSSITESLLHLAIKIPLLKEKNAEPTEPGEWSTGQAVICPTFGGGENSVIECVFTNPAVQHAILSFFEEVAQDPANYHNPHFAAYLDAPQPTLADPLTLLGDEQNFSSLPLEMMPEQVELNEARQILSDLHCALAACPTDIEGLDKGRKRLVEKIQAKEVEIEELENKALASGGLKAGEGTEKRENWKPQKQGKKVAFAGTVVDSELLKAAGLLDTAAVELEKLDESEEKAFI